jgi:predicted PurR-regulated permease PerM
MSKKIENVVESIEETKDQIEETGKDIEKVLEETGKDVSNNVEQLNTILDVYQPIVEKLTSWIGYGLVFIGLLLLVNVALIMYLVIRK